MIHVNIDDDRNAQVLIILLVTHLLQRCIIIKMQRNEVKMGNVNLEELGIPSEIVKRYAKDDIDYCTYRSNKYSRWQKALANSDGSVLDFFICDIFYNFW